VSQQRVGSLALCGTRSGSTRCRDTTTVNAIVHEAWARRIAMRIFLYDVSDRRVANFSGPRMLEA